MVSTAMNEAIKSLWSGLSMQGTHPPTKLCWKPSLTDPRKPAESDRKDMPAGLCLW